MDGITLKPFAPMLAIMAMIALGGCDGPQTAPNPETSPAPVSLGIEDGSRQSHALHAFHRYQTAVSLTEQRKWICIAVNHDLPEAQSELARLHWRYPGAPRSPFRQDMAQAYAWSLIAIGNGQPLDQMEQRLGSAMTSDEQWSAKGLAALWTPDPSHCDHIGETGCLHAT